MIDYQNPTLEQVEALIPDSVKYKLEGIATSWSKPENLRLMREWANRVVPKKNPFTWKNQYECYWVITDENTPVEIYNRWEQQIAPFNDFVDSYEIEFSAYGHFVQMIAQNLRNNWNYYEAAWQVCIEFGCLPEDKEGEK